MFSDCMDSPCCASEAAQPRSGAEHTQQQQPGLPGSRLVSGVVSAQGEPRILEPLVQERVVEVMKEEIQERVIEVPQVQYVDRYVEVPQHVVQEKVTQIAKPVIQERVKHVHKPVYQEKIIEVPQVKEIGKAQGVFQRGGVCYSLSSCCAPQRDAITELDKAGAVEILAQQGYSSMPLPAHWDKAQPPAGWEGWSSEQVPMSLRADREMAARLAAVPVQSYQLESQQHVPQMTTQSVRTGPQHEGRVSTQEQAASSNEGTHVQKAFGPYVKVVVTPVKLGEESEVNVIH